MIRQRTNALNYPCFYPQPLPLTQPPSPDTVKKALPGTSAKLRVNDAARAIPNRRDARAVESGGLENRCTLMGTGGSNPPLSVSCFKY